MAKQETSEEKDARRKKRKEWEALLNKAGEAALSAHEGNIRLAGDGMAAAVRADPRLREAVFELILDEACHERIRRILQIQNQSIWHHASDPTMRSRRLQRAMETANKIRLMDYSLMGGLPLALANRPQVLRNATFQGRQAARMAQTSLWLRAISERMVDDKQLVRDLFTEEELRDLQSRAISEIETTEDSNPQKTTV